MRLEKNPVFRKVIVPWYDSETLCFLLIFFMVIVFLFSIVGILVSGEELGYRDYVWVPILLTIMSGVVITSITVRIARRYMEQYSNRI